MSKYNALVSILDRIRKEGMAAGFTSYGPANSTPESESQARGRAYIHLFIKVKFGILSFSEREKFITDGTQDGGIDGYFVDADSRTIFLLQSKFRATEKNFEGKKITLDEIAAMDTGRIVSGETHDERGVEYNGKIRGLIRNISEIEDIGRYKYQVIIIANLQILSQTILRNLSGGFPVEIFDFERCYSELVFPVLSGTYFQKEELNILLDLTNKNAGSKITYEVATTFGPCDITVLFVPTLEIAKTMYKYKNAILKHNPRSYLEFEGAPVNDSIRETIVSGTSNEFALLNNGITMISDETSINEKIGQKSKAQLYVKNPQIINGGQTAFTLSRIYQSDVMGAEKTFEGKEVLLKVITLALSEQNQKSNATAALIDRISTATNRQTAVTNADRHSIEDGFIELQKLVFDRFGVLFERKRGEFGEGIREGYLSKNQVMERNTFAKIYFAANGRFSESTNKRAFLHIKDPKSLIDNEESLVRFHCGYLYFLASGMPAINKKNKLPIAKIFAFTFDFFSSSAATKTGNEPFKIAVDAFERKWERFAQEKEYGIQYGSRNKQMGQLFLDVCDFFEIPRDAHSHIREPRKRPKTEFDRSTDSI